MLQTITIRSTENVIKIVEKRPELKDLDKNDVSFFRGIILNDEQMTKGINLDKRQLDAVVTNPKSDSYGDTINPNGIDWTRYDKNPALLWQHRAELGNIGTCVKHFRDDQDNTVATFQFAEGVQLADDAWKLYSQHVQRAFSIGFRVKKWGTAITENDPDGYVFDAIEIFEISAVSIPAVEDALTMKSFDKLYEELEKTCNHTHKNKLKPEHKHTQDQSTPEDTTNKRLDNIEKLLNTIVKSISGDNITIEDKQPDKIDNIKIVESIRAEAKSADKSLGKILKNMKILIKD